MSDTEKINGGKNQISMQIQADFTVETPGAAGKQVFQTALGGGKEGIDVRLAWLNEQNLTIGQFLKLFQTAFENNFPVLKGIHMPDFSWIPEKVEAVCSQKNGFLLRINFKDQEGKTVTQGLLWMGGKSSKEESWALQFRTYFPILLKNIPLLGNAVKEEDGISGMNLVLQNRGGKLRYGLQIDWRLGERSDIFTLGEMTQIQQAAPVGNTAAAPAAGHIGAEDLAPRLSQSDTKGDSIHWIDIQKSIGPFRILQVGFEMKNDGEEYAAYLYFSVQMSFSVIQVELVGLYIKIPFSLLQIKHFSDLKKLGFGFQGLGITYESGPLLISGFLVRRQQPERKTDAYEGMIRVQFQQFQLMAFGAYSTTESGKTSLFAYLLVKYPLGGPPAFFVTGLAAAFGINRRLLVPDVRQIPKFPLIAMVTGTKKDYSITEAGNMLKAYIQEADGEYFIAAGIEFTSFEIMRSFVLVSVVFGKKFVLYLLGISEIRYPIKGTTFVFVQLALRAEIAPDDGFFSFEAVLTSESYLFSTDCHLRGGFAFYLWTKGQHKGDFVITLGGYHPKFQKPAHYPTVDRVGVQWNITNHLSLNGEAYFAVTSSAMMAGGKLELLYQNGNLKAWLNMQADFLLQWAPFYYDIYIDVRVGVSYVLKIWFVRVKLKVELGAGVHLYGPEFAGEIKISWCIISFTIKFGAKNPRTERISYNEFKAKFLQEPLQISVCKGLLDKEEEGGNTILHIHPLETVFQIESRIPMTRIVMDDKTPESLKNMKIPAVGVWPMGQDLRLETVNQVKMYRYTKDGWIPFDKIQGSTVCVERENVPAALWGRTKPDPYKAEFIEGAVTRLLFHIENESEEKNHCTPAYDYEVLTANECIEYKAHAQIGGRLYVMDNLDEGFDLYMGDNMYHQSFDTYKEKLAMKRREEGAFFEKAGLPVWKPEQLEEWEIYQKPAEHFFLSPVMRRIQKEGIV